MFSLSHHRLRQLINIAFDPYVELTKTHIRDKILEYLDKVKNKRFGSKLDLAGELMSDRFTLLLETFINIVSRIEDGVSKTVSIINVSQYVTCRLALKTSVVGLLPSFLAKMYDHYNKTTGTQKANMNKYFLYLDKTALLVKMVRDQKIVKGECYELLNFKNQPTFTKLTRMIKHILEQRVLLAFDIKL